MWKEDELKQLKSELAAIDRNIQLELAPKQEETQSHGQEQGGQEIPKAEACQKFPMPMADLSATTSLSAA